MNKGITLTILGVLLCAMSLVFYSHLNSPSSQPLPGVQADQPPSGTTSSGSFPSGGNLPPLEPTPVPSVKARSTQPVAPTSPESVKKPETKPETKPAEKPVAVKPVEKPAEKPTPVVEPTKPAEKPVPEAKPAGEKETPATTSASAEKPAEKPVAPPIEKPAEVKPVEAKIETKPVLTPLASLSQTANHTLKAIGLHFSGNQIFLRIEAENPFPFSTFHLVSPDRLVIDLPGNWKGIKTPTIPSNQLVTSVRVGQQKKGPRFVVDLSRKPAGHEVVRVSDTVLEVHFKE